MPLAKDLQGDDASRHLPISSKSSLAGSVQKVSSKLQIRQTIANLAKGKKPLEHALSLKGESGLSGNGQRRRGLGLLDLLRIALPV